jgi:hypothetical protein
VGSKQRFIDSLFHLSSGVAHEGHGHDRFRALHDAEQAQKALHENAGLA